MIQIWIDEYLIGVVNNMSEAKEICLQENIDNAEFVKVLD